MKYGGNKTMKTFIIPHDPYDTGFCVFEKNKITLKPGLTVFVGCNGSGKSSLLHCIESLLKEENIPNIFFDNLKDGGQNALSEAEYMGDLAFLATAAQSSEGENIIMNLGTFAGKVGKWVRRNRDAKELWILLDACDSGLSIDNVIDIKKYLFQTIINDNPKSNVYILAAANEYEMASGESCFDVVKGQYVSFQNYEEYKTLILRSNHDKKNRKEMRSTI